MARLSAVALLSFVILEGCGRDSAVTGGEVLGWTRYDLLQAPRVEDPPGGDSPVDGPATDDPAAAEVRVRPHLLGHGIPLARRAKKARRGSSPRLAGVVQTLEGPLDRDLRWRLKLGVEPFVSFVPLSRRRSRCKVVYLVQVDGPGGQRRVSTREAAYPSSFSPPTIEIPLSEFAGQVIELVLRVQANGARCRKQLALWGSPAVYSRHAMQAGPGSVEQPNVILLGLDTLRADALGVYGRRPSPSPAIDRLAAESDVWLKAFSTFNVTGPSFASMMTGLYGKNHGIYDLYQALPEQHRTLAELLSETGYETGAVLSARHLKHAASGLGQGFDLVETADRQGAAQWAVDTSMNWISERRRPFFLWLHLFDAHTPHTPPQPYVWGYGPARAGLLPVDRWVPFRTPTVDSPLAPPRQADVPYDDPRLGGHTDLYAGEVAYLDRQIGRLLDFLASRGLMDRTVIALVADHGENMGERGIRYRHAGLWDSTTHVPMMIRWPGGESGGRLREGMVQTLDLFPTLLKAAGVAPPASDGQDLRSEEDVGRRWIFAEASGNKGAMIRSSQYLFFQAFEDQIVKAGSYLYDLSTDPTQAENLAGRGSPVENRLSQALERWRHQRSEVSSGGEVVPLESMTEDQIDQLKALGYLGGS